MRGRSKRTPSSEGLAKLAFAAAAVATAFAAALAAGPFLERHERREADAALAAALGTASADVAHATAAARVRAVELATAPAVQRAFAMRDAGALRRLERDDRSVSLAFAPARADRTVATADVRDGDGVLGYVHVAVDLAAALAGARSSDVLPAFVRSGRVELGPQRGGPFRARVGRPVDVRLGGTDYRALAQPVGDGGRGDLLVALQPRSTIAERAHSRRRFAFAAAVALLGAIALGGSAVPRLRALPLRARRRRAERMTAREALALVGDALAATHEPRALLTIVLTAAIEATGAVGACLIDDGVEVARAGNSARGDALDLELETSGTRGVLRLFPPRQGFTADEIALARSLASQASIALENAHLHQIVERQATTDDLTQLANRRAFMTALEGEIRRSDRSHDPFALIIADLDEFKSVNDNYGHGTGDRVLVGFARTVEHELREIDLAARLGGEEFALLLPQTNLEGGNAVAERVRDALAREGFVGDDGEAVRITVSLGVTAYSPGSSAEALLFAADSALYAAKAAGKNRVVSRSGAPSSRRRPPRS